jgi:putative transposase
MTLYKDKYRVESARLKGWDYSAVGYYFVTICMRDRLCTLGNVIDGVVRLTPVGEIVAEEWQKTAQIRKNVTLDEWVVMPNHLHGIVVIHEKETPQHETPQHETPHRGVSTEEPDDCRDVPVARLSQTLPGRLRKGSLGAIIGQFKSVCTKRIWAAGHDFAWQSRFYDEIIDDEKSLVTIREYIRNNPLKWQFDKENPANYPK